MTSGAVVTTGAAADEPIDPPAGGLPAVGLVPDRPHSAPVAGSTATATHRLPAGTAAAVRAGARAHGTAAAAVWAAALLTVLHRHTGQTDLALGSRGGVLRADLGDGARFADLVARCGPDPGAHLRLRPALRTPDGAHDGAADIVVTVGEAELAGHYPPELFDGDRVERLLGHVAAAVRSGLADPAARVADVDILPAAERDRVLRGWQPRPVPAPPGLLHDVTAGHDPHRVAIRLGRTELTYGELDRRANRLAHALHGQGIGAGHVVGLLLDRGLHLPIAQLAVMRAGAAWLPMDPQQPPARLGFLAADSAASLVLTSRALADHARASAPDLPRWHLDDPGWATTVEHLPGTAPDVEVSPDDPAYLLYTSGSTGTPKGVLVPHRCARHYCGTAVEMYRTTPDDRVAQASNPAFDASVFDTWATFLAGATLVAAPSATIADPAAFTELLRSEGVTLSFIPPAVLALLDADDLATTALRGIFSAGEALPPEQATRWGRAGLELHNSYGPTETTVVVTDHICTGEPLTGPTPIGTALRNHRAYALDDRLHPAPIGVPGQLFVAGPGVTYGYHARPALTAERFLPDPYGSPGERMYATGDIVSWRADGLLEFLGRRDRQVQVRGQRVELGEIEHTLGRHPDVRQCAVLLHGGTQLVAYLAGTPDPDELRSYLADRLPTAMIPTALIVLPVLPLTPNGKLDTAALPAPAPAAAAGLVAPGTGTERWLADAWRTLLDVEEVGTGDDFFDLGGNSLHAIRLVAMARESRGADLQLRHVFTHPVLGQLAGLLDRTGPVASTAPIVPVPREGTLAASHQQDGLWLQHQVESGAGAYRVGLRLRLHGPLDVAALERALHTLVVRHESLRTRFTAVDGTPRQVIDPPPAARPVPVVDVPADRVEGWVAARLREPFDLATGPLLRTPLARVAPDDHVLLIVVHHIVADGWSIRLIADELAVLYRTGPDQAPSAPPLQPADHTAWQRAAPSAAELGNRLAHWRDRLAGLPTVNLPTDRPRPARPTGAGRTVHRRLPDELAAAARGYARTHRVSFLAVHHAALLTVLHRHTGQTDLSVGSMFSGRTTPELDRMVGLFANAVVLRTDIGGRPTFAEVVRRCHAAVVDAAAHQDVPFALVVDAVRPDRVPGRNPLFQISLSMQPPDTALAGLALGAATAHAVDLDTGYARFDLAIAVIETAGGRLDLQVEHSTELFDADRVSRLLDHVVAALAGGLAAPDTAVGDVGVLPAAELERVLPAGDPHPRPAGLLHGVLAGHDPGRTALRHDGAELTYGDLRRRAARLARALRAEGIGRGDLVGVLADRGVHLAVAQLAAMAAGAAWTPLDPQHPAARLAWQVDDAAVRTVLTTTDLAHLLPDGTPRRCLDGGAAEDDSDDAEAGPPADVHPDDPAYLLYTSGSTGVPKGILVSHRSAHGFCHVAVQHYGLSRDDRVARTANPAFDVSILDTYATWLAGGVVVGAPRETFADPDRFTALLREERITLSYVPPALLALLDPDTLAAGDLRTVICAGETLTGELASRWARPDLALHNGYGPTEATVLCTDHRCPDAPFDGPTPIGTALPGCRVHVLDGELRPVPIGVPGQLFVSGAGVAHGYLGRPGATAERFLPDPHGAPGERMYATGDIARRTADGLLVHLGRDDRQVSLRGQRVELGEIEHVLARHPGVAQCAVVLHDGTRLVAHVAGDPDLDDLRAFLADRLPTHMVPTRYLVQPTLPVTPNGKIDFARLSVPDLPVAEHVECRTPTERWMAATWRELLAVPRVGAGDGFFDVGGNSLHVAQLVSRVRDRFDVELPLREVFTSPTLGDLAARTDEAVAAAADAPGELDDEIAALERLLAERAGLQRLLEEKRAAKAQRSATRQITRVPRDGPLVCTHHQEGLWFEHQLDPASTVYHIAFALRLRGDLDAAALGRALHALVVRHESLRTRFVDEGGLPRQVIESPPPARPLPVVEMAPDDVEAWVAAEIGRPMDLSAGGLVRTPLARLHRSDPGPAEHVLILIVHHIVADGWSARILAGELTQLYAAETGVGEARLPELPVQPADHAAWQRAVLDGGELARQLAYWRSTLADLPTIDLPADRPRPVDPSGAGETLSRRLPDDLALAVRAFARARRCSFLAVSQAALLMVLHRWTGQTDLPIGSIFSGRTRVDTEPMVGYFVNAVVLRTRIDGDPSFAALVDRCHDTVLAASTNQDVPFGLVVDALRPDRVPGRNQLFQVNLSLQPPGATLGGLNLGSVTAEPLPVSAGYARFDLAVSVVDGADGSLEFGAEYSTELFDGDRIDRLLDHLVTALGAGIAASERPVTALDVMPAGERDRVLRAFNDTAAPRRSAPLHHRVSVVAARTPDAVAVVDHDGTRLTYRELDAVADRLALRLRRRGVGPGVPVGVCLDRGADLVTALLATWKAGGAFLPLDPELPRERIGFMVAEAAPPVVLTHSAHAAAFAAGTALALDVDREPPDPGPPTAPEDLSTGDDAAYVLYTSGSTGAPKGVVVSHRALDNRIAWMQEAHPLGPDDRVLQKTPCGFDVALWEFAWPLVTGAALVLAAPGGHRDPDHLHELVRREGVTTLHFVPTMLRAFLDAVADRGPLGRVRRVFCSGETLPPDSARRFLAAWPDVELHNLYGPTEAAIDVTAWRCSADATTVPIGAPIANTRAYVLDGRLDPVPIGVPGQLFLAGTCLADGYLHRPGLTAERFLPDPHGGPGERMYATGDLASWRADGVLDHLGRTDRQVKLHGQRIEPGEIEHVLRLHPRVRESAVTVRDGALVGYVVGDAAPEEVRRFAAERLPTTMVPRTVVVLPELPVTTNGKLDTAALPGPAAAAAAFVPPRTATERWLAETWRELLSVEVVGVGDTLFGLGANSLHTTQLTARIRRHLGVHVHPRHLFTDPTLAELAALLDASASAPPGAPDPLVTLRACGSRPPLFLVHPVGGAVTHYLELAELLGDDRPVHAIEDPQLHGAAPAADLADRARRYVELVRRVQPHGPYHLGGWSLGGSVAVEMAGQLTDAGETVALVAALDAGLAEPRRTPTDLEALVWFVVDVAGTAGAALPQVDLDALGGLDRDALEELALGVLAGAGLAPAGTHEDVRARMRVFATNLRHHAEHRPRTYDGRLVLVDARDGDAPDGNAPDGNAPDGNAGTGPDPDLTRPERLTVPGDHYSMLRAPHVHETAAALRRYLG